MPARVLEIVSAAAGRKNLENAVALRALTHQAAAIGKSNFHQRATPEIMLVLDGGDIQIVPVVDRGLDRIEYREPVPVVIAVIHKKTPSQDVRRWDVHLKT